MFMPLLYAHALCPMPMRDATIHMVWLLALAMDWRRGRGAAD
jgi:hypothetical protein